jgi:polysaccharide export outer membrane protein
MGNKVKYLILFVLAFAVHIMYAQNPLLGSDLRNLKADQLTDAQVREFANQAAASGMSEEQIERIALQKGAPQAELNKLKARISSLKFQSQGLPRNPMQTSLWENRDTTAKVAATSSQDSATNTFLAPAPVNPGDTMDPTTEIYGHQLFRNVSLQTFEKATDVRAPDNYLIGIGDELAISVFGYSYYNEVLKVDGAGFINATGVGPINVKGLTFDKTKALIKAKFAGYFDMSNNQLTVSLSYSRIITVNIIGEVSKPGSYKMPAINTLFNALVAVGGPGQIGSVRNIQVKRNNRVVKSFDVYEFLSGPSSRDDYFLENNDYIFVPASGKVVSIRGEVKRPMRYELKPKENLTELLAFAGGLTSKAYSRLINISRLSEDGRQKLLLSISLDSLITNKKQFVLMDGDEIQIGAKSEEMSQYIEIEGAVNMPGKFEYREGERISDLLTKANGVKYESLVEKAFLIRLKPDLTREYISINIKDIIDNPGSPQDIALKKGDIIRIASNRDFSNELKVDAIGAFRKPNSIPYSEGMTLGDVLFLAGGLKMEADILNIEVSRISFFTEEYQPGEPSRILIKTLQIGKDIKIADDQLSFQLRPFDQVFARLVPDFEYQQNITIVGEVKYPGVYALESKDERLSGLVKRSGGLNRFAFPEGSTLYRPSLPGGYIVMNLKDVMRNDRSKYNYVLKAGDVINVPRTIDFIAVRGDIGYLQIVNQEQVNAPYVRGKRANYYIKEFSNGFTKTSWKKKTYVVDNNAKVNRTKNFLLFKVYPKVKKGSVVYVIPKEEKVKKTRPSDPIDWNRTIESFTIKLTGIATLMILFQNIK